MHSWIINKDDFYSNIPDLLRYHVPEFHSIWDNDDIYMMLFEFGEFFIKNMASTTIRNNCINFINEALEKGGNNTEDAIVMQVFQQIYDNAEYTQLVKIGMTEKSINIFDKYYREYKK